MADMQGLRLGAYELLERIGGGGMAEVYRARQLSAFGRLVAVKVIRSGFSEEASFRQRFLREAQAISRLSHPHILPLIEFGEEQLDRGGQHQSLLYLVMPLAREGTLRDRLKQQGGALPLSEAVPLFLQLCAAVQYAHEEGILHRDLKPQNVLLQHRSHVLLADFGIARDLAQAQPMTTTGAGIGTVEYMAPEQALGQATRQSDLYSLGIVLYQVVTGSVPYTGSTPFQVLTQHVQAPLPDPRAVNPQLPAELGQVLQHALAKAQEHRFSSAQAFARAVQQVRPDAPSDRPSPPGVLPPSLARFPSSQPSLFTQTTRPGQDFRDMAVDPDVPMYPGGSPPSRPSGMTGTLTGRQRPRPLSSEQGHTGPGNDDQPTRNTQGDRTAKTAPGWQQRQTGPLPSAGSQFPPQPVLRRRRGLLLSALVAGLLVLAISLISVTDPLGWFNTHSDRQVAQQTAMATAPQQTAMTTASQQATTTGPQPTITTTASTTPTLTPTRTATPTFTPTPTSTATPVPTFKVTGVSATVSPNSWDPPCIDFASFDFTATINVNLAPTNRTVTYYWTFSDGSSYVPTSVTVPTSSTSITASANWTFTSPPPDSAYWAEIVITVPNSVTSNKATFTIAC